MSLGIIERIRRFRGDKIILILVVGLSLISILLVYSTEGKRVVTHIVHLLFCYAGLGIFYFINYKKLVTNFSLLGLLLAIVLLVWTLGSSAVRGVTLFGFDLQTFYFIGFLIIVFISNYIGRRFDNGQTELDNKEMVYASIVLLGFCGGIALLNMSTAIILFLTGLAMFFVGNFKWRGIFSLVGLVGGLVLIVTLLVATGKLDNVGRISTFVNRWEYYFTKDNQDGYGDQMILSRAAIARSGLHPAGPGRGVIKYRLPENSTDYAFAALFEETGFVVGLIVIFIYMTIFYRSWHISRNSKSAMGSLLAFGIGFWMTCQAFVHIGVNCELLPATGQTLPFISTGGASLFVSGCAVGMLLNVSKMNVIDSQKPDPHSMFIRGESRQSGMPAQM